MRLSVQFILLKTTLSIFLVLRATGDHPTDEDALDMIAEADIDGDGRSKRKQYIRFRYFLILVNYDEFVLIMTSNTSPRK